MRVGTNHNLGAIEHTADLFSDMGHEDLHSIGRPKSEGRMGDRSDDPHASLETDLIAVVIAKAGQDRAFQFAEWRHDDRRNEISGKDHQLAFETIKLRHGAADIVDVIVSIREQPDAHIKVVSGV